MMNFIKKEKKGLVLLFICLTLIMLAYFGMYVFQDLPLLYGTDLRPQWFLFYEEFKELISNFVRNQELPFYSWNLFLGTNFYASKSYYLMGDIFSYIGLLFRTDFFDTALILEIIKFYTAGLGMYLFLSKHEYKIPVKVIGAIAYTFSGWAIFFSGQMVFLSFYAWMPYYFLTMENYLQNKKGILFSVFTAILLFTNFYFFFTISALSPIYFLYRYYCIHHSFEGWFKSALELIGYYAVGFLITMVLTLPTFYEILSNDRVASFDESMIFEAKVYFHYLVSTLIPNYLYIYSHNIFETGAHYSREICMYGGTLIALLIPQIFVSKDKYYRKATLTLYGVFFIFLMFPYLCAILHGLGDPSLRWAMFIIFINILVACNILNDLDEINVKVLNRSLGLIILLLLAVVPVATVLTEQIEPFIYSYQIKLFIGYLLVYLINWYVIKKNYKYSYFILIAVLCLEMGYSGYRLYDSKISEAEYQNNDFNYRVTHVLQSEKNGVNNFLDSLNEFEGEYQYYRVYIPHEELYWSYSHNMSLMYQLNGVMTYDSTYASSLNKLKDIVPEIKDFESEWIFNIKDNDLLNFLNIKYAIATKETVLPEDVNWVYLEDIDYYGFMVYQNLDYRPLGTSYSQIKTYEEFDNTKELLNNVICEQEDYDEIANYLGNSDATLEDITYSDNHLMGWINSIDESFMVLSLPYDEGWDIMVNGESVEIFNVNGGFIGFAIPEGGSQLEMYFTPQGFRTGAILSGLGILYLFYLVYRSKKKIH